MKLTNGLPIATLLIVLIMLTTLTSCRYSDSDSDSDSAPDSCPAYNDIEFITECYIFEISDNIITNSNCNCDNESGSDSQPRHTAEELECFFCLKDEDTVLLHKILDELIETLSLSDKLFTSHIRNDDTIEYHEQILIDYISSTTYMSLLLNSPTITSMNLESLSQIFATIMTFCAMLHNFAYAKYAC